VTALPTTPHWPASSTRSNRRRDTSADPTLRGSVCRNLHPDRVRHRGCRGHSDPWLLGWTWTQALYKALVLLVIACPCALVLATPVTVVSGLAAAARRGILIKGGVYLEEARKLRVIALDKTGTITEGKPRLVATELLPSTVPESQVLAWAASLAGHSDHPVSKAIATGLKLPENGLTDFRRTCRTRH
jgi:cation transport ATPase